MRLPGEGVAEIEVGSTSMTTHESYSFEPLERPEFWSVEAIVDAFAERDVVITPKAASDLFNATQGWPALVAAAVAVHSRGTICDDASIGIRASWRAARTELAETLPPHWVGLINYLAVSGIASLRELDARVDGDLLPEIMEARAATSVTLGGEPCATLVPALAHVVGHDLTDDAVARLRREIALARKEIGVLDYGLADAFKLGDHRLCAQIMDEWSIPMAAGRYRNLSTDVLLALPQSLAAEFPTLGHRLEMYGKLRVGTTPIDVPTRPQDIEAACAAGAAVAVMRETFYAMSTRQRFDTVGAAQVARLAAPLVDHSMQVDGGPTSGLAPLWYLHAGISCHRVGDLAGARHFYRLGWEHRAMDRVGFVGRDLASKLALLAACDGDSRQAFAWIDENQTCVMAHWIHGRLKGWVDHCAILARHALAVDRLDLRSVGAWADRGPVQDPYDAFWAFGVWVQARYALLSGRAHLVAGMVGDARARYPAIAQGAGLHREQLAEVSAEAMLALGKGSEAAANLQHLPAGSIHRRVVETRLKLLSGNVVEALRLAADHQSRSDTRTRDLAELALLEAAASLASGDLRRAGAAATVALRRANAREDHRTFATISRDDLEALTAIVPALRVEIRLLDERGVAEIYPPSIDLVELSQRERVVLTALDQSGTLPEIASSLYVSRNTIKAQLRSIYAKLGVSSRTEAVAVGRQLGLLLPSSHAVAGQPEPGQSGGVSPDTAS